MDIAGRKALVFGGTSGIGLAASKQLNRLLKNPLAFWRKC
jgi:NAD(P)-dependent dehydrogenase (short-subunit alcohol dehydrogenase family)